MMLGTQQVLKAIATNNADPDARALLGALQSCFGVPAAGEFSAQLIDLIADWQRGAALLADGVIGAKTRARLAALDYLAGAPCDNLWPHPQANPYAHWTGLLLTWGVPLPTDGTPILLGLRGCYPFARVTHRMVFAPRFDDTFVLLRPSAEPLVFAGSSHAYQLDSKESPDVDGDGRGDVGSIRPGRYLLTDLHGEPPIFWVKLPSGSDQIPAFRDTDHDGIISEAEALRSTSAHAPKPQTNADGMYASNVLFHPGFQDIKPGEERPFSSISCQTAPVAQLRALRMAGPKIHFELMNAAEVAAGVAPTIPPPPDNV